MKNWHAIEEVAKQRINQNGGDLEKVLDTAKGLLFAGIPQAKIYAFAKTGQWSSKRATQEYHDAINEFYTVVRGH